MNDLLMWILSWFDESRYVAATQIQGLLWSAADLTLLWMLLKITDLIRGKRATYRWIVWSLTAVATPLLFFMHTRMDILMLEAAICGTQFLLLLEILLRERVRTVEFIQNRLR